MYVVERSPATEDLSLNFGEVETYPKKQVHALLHHSQALPAEPGGLLAWQHTTLHWGGRFRHSVEPRLAVSFEFTRKDYEPKDLRMRMACDPTQPLPSLAHRLRWISMSLLGFRGREVVVERFVPLARRILA
jgi:ectoine hydroxylase-related dioxygenase (phytanoyl-CoA dioxygenase family)